MRNLALGRHVSLRAAAFWILSFAARVAAAGSGPNRTTEKIALAGLRQSAEILIDRWGVPHIYAKNEPDLFFVQGFNAARDRLFQIDLWRRRGLGQLSEIFGPAFIEQDKATRMFLYRGDMQKEWAAYSSDSGQIAGYFVAGVNAYIDWLRQHPERTPFEFRKLNYTPAKWEPRDVVRIRTHGLTGNLQNEVDRSKVVCAADMHADQIRYRLQPEWQTHVLLGLDPCLPPDVLKMFVLATQEVRLTPQEPKTAISAGAELALGVPNEGVEGSNSWVIGPAKSATGRAVMANDPHRAYGEPSLRYISHLDAPTLHAIGANEPQLPGISIGHNDWIAFGYTRFYIDQEDLYVYELNPANPEEYKYQGQWEPFRLVREEIKIKGEQPMAVDLKFTRHGPVIFVDRPGNRAFAVKCAWLEPGTAPYYNSIRYIRARNFEEFKRTISHWGAPGLNHVYADVKGNIGWVAGGLAPIRPNWDGLMPVPGDGRFEWAGRWTGDQLPSMYNPKSGYLTTSNEMNMPADYPYKERKLGFEWLNDSRHQRIDEMFHKLDKLTIEDSMRLQNDQTSIPARRLVSLLQSLSSSDPRTQSALDILKRWDASFDVDGPAPVLHEVWFSRHLLMAFKYAVLPKNAADSFLNPDTAVMLEALERPETLFGDHAFQKCNELLLTSLRSAYDELEKMQGSDTAQWRWAKVHYNLSEHPFAAIVDETTRAKINVGPIPKTGSEYVPNLSLYRPTDFRQIYGPSLRIVLDVGNWDNSRAVNHPGQSGDPDSPHYRDLAPMWRNGQYFRLLYTRKAIEQATEHTIKLFPRT
jgi:penicillin amidase